jgi:transposase-like protein
VEIISHGVWLYYRFPLSFREVQEMMAQRGIVVSHETVRQWCAKFGHTYASGLRRRQPRPGDKWHLDEVFITIRGKTHYLWRAVDQEGNVLDILVTSRRDAKAATRFFRKLLKGLTYVPRVLVTDKLASYGVAHRRADPGSGASPVEVSEQPRREFPPTHPSPGTRDEEVHLSRARPAVPVRLQRHIPALPAPPPPAHRRGIPLRDAHPIHYLERGHRHGHRSRLSAAAEIDPRLLNPGSTRPSTARSSTS